MGVGVRVAMSREVFGSSEDTMLLHSTCIGDAKCSDTVRIGTITASADDRIARVTINVYDGSEVDMYAESLCLESSGSSVLVSEEGVVSSTDDDIAWPVCSPGESHRESPLTVHGYEHGDGRGRLAHTIDKLYHRLWVSFLP